MRFRPALCDPDELRPDYARLDETSLVRFLERQHVDARIDRPRADLLYVNVGGAGTEKPIRLRVAILGSADEAGRELHQGSCSTALARGACVGPTSPCSARSGTDGR